MQYDSEAQLEWGGGLKQRVEATERAAAMAAEAAKPFARSADDAELDAMHRRRSRWGDPMVRCLGWEQALMAAGWMTEEGRRGRVHCGTPSACTAAGGLRSHCMQVQPSF